MQRIAILGRGAAGKSTLATELARRLELPLIELDAVFWQPDLTPMAADAWQRSHLQLVTEDRWIIDGDLGVHDRHLDERLARADTVLVLDFPAYICVPRAVRRARENREFWRWMLRYRRDSLPSVMAAARRSGAEVRVLRSPRAVARFLAGIPSA